MTDDTHIWSHLVAVFMARPEFSEASDKLKDLNESKTDNWAERAPHVITVSGCILDALVSVHKEYVKENLKESAKVLEAYVKAATDPQSLSSGAYWFRMGDKKKAQATKVYFWENSVQNKG